MYNEGLVLNTPTCLFSDSTKPATKFIYVTILTSPVCRDFLVCETIKNAHPQYTDKTSISILYVSLLFSINK